MRGASQTLSRLNVSRLALIATVSVFATGLVGPTNAAAKSPDQGQGQGTATPPTAPLSAINGDSVAYAVPRNAPAGNVEITLPQPLSPSDVAIYQRIQELQGEGKTTDAANMAQRLTDPSVMGAMLAALYLSPGYKTTPAELTDWWSKYAAEPEAADIYGLMQHKLRRADLPAAPQISLLPEETMTAGAAAPAVSAPDGAAWHAAFATGLTAWQKGDIEGAGTAFATSASIVGISDDDRAASQFWAARASLRLMQPTQYLDWLRQAAAQADTFYGMLAGRLLGQGFAATGIAATLTEADVTAVDATPQGHLAFAELQLGLTDAAAANLRALWPQMQGNPDLSRSVMAIAARAGLADVAIAIANTQSTQVDEIAGAHLPLPGIHPAGGFTVDPALVYALARTESGFNAHAVSRCGARGLMQLMPITATAVRQHVGISGNLSNPADNLAIGQAYLNYLGQQPGIDNNLLAIIASYNAGPGAASAWYSQLQEDSDPLLFIETISNAATRRFVRQVMADSWLYSAEIGLTPLSLNQLAAGSFPTLASVGAVASAN
jgi:soluble lytic murein transglycosylase-like protein